MINDQERFRILRAAYDLSVAMGRPLGGDELLSFYSATTGDTVEQPKWVRSLKELEVLGDLNAQFFKDTEGTPRVQMIQVTQGGTKLAQQQASIAAHSSSSGKKSWLTANKRWAIGLGVTLFAAVVGFVLQMGKPNPHAAPQAHVGGNVSAGRDVWVVGNADSISSKETAKGSVSNERIASLEFENEWPFVDRVVRGNDLTGRSWGASLFQVGIPNHTESTVQVQHVKLAGLRQLEGDNFKPWDAEPVILEWPPKTPSKIPPGDTVLVPFARIYPPELQREEQEDRIYSGDVNVPQLRFTVEAGGWPKRMRSDVPPGTYRFKVTAFFETLPPAEVELELTWPGKLRDSVEAMVQDIKIRRVEKADGVGSATKGVGKTTQAGSP